MIFCLSTLCAIGFDFRDVLWKRFNKKEAKRHDTMALPYLQLSLVTWSSLGAAKMATTEQPRSRTRFGTYLALRCCQASLPSDNPSEFNIPFFHCLEIQQISRLSVFVTHKLFFGYSESTLFTQMASVWHVSLSFVASSVCDSPVWYIPPRSPKSPPVMIARWQFTSIVDDHPQAIYSDARSSYFQNTCQIR